MRSLQALFDLHGRVAIVTGGAGHIGSAIAYALADSGASIMIIDLDEERCAREATALASLGVEVLGIATDLEREDEVRDIPKRALARFGRLDILVNCAAFGGTTNLPGWAVPVENQSAESWRRALEVNLTAPFLLTQAAMDPLSKSGHGSVINILSIYGLVAPDNRLYEGTSMGNPAAYGASKAALEQLTRYFATAMAPRVRCNAITPGGVLRGQPEAFQTQYVARTPLGRMAIEEDFKGAAAFLASDASAYVTGQNIVVDGGWTIW